MGDDDTFILFLFLLFQAIHDLREDEKIEEIFAICVKKEEEEEEE